MKRSRKPILCLDFDGVLHAYTSGWQGAARIPDPPVFGAIEFLIDAREHFQVSVFSSRSHQWGGRRAMKRWLEHHAREHFDSDLTQGSASDVFLADVGAMTMDPWDKIIEYGARKLVQGIDFPRHKPPAMVSLDDRCCQFMGTWPRVAALLEFQPWNKRTRK